ncbi:MAG: hypothetical protein JWQ35_2146 [Bacteriovoracaceae bacterium]|nr:hypothetical protein [Bacteriovoracaceae bacterium]
MMSDKVKLDLPAVTALKIFIFVGVGYAFYLLLPLFLILFLACLLAITLEPVTRWLERHGFKRGLAVIFISFVLLSLLTLFIVFVLPTLFHQLGSFVEDFPSYRDKLFSRFPEGTFFNRALRSTIALANAQSFGEWMTHLATVGQVTATVILKLLFLFVIAVYLLADGKSAYRWIRHFFPPATQNKMDSSADEMIDVVIAFTTGQGICSLLAIFYTFLILNIFSVPAALTLALLAGIFDILPVLGFILFSIPAILLALTVSEYTALMVFLFYLVYHGIEAYILVPKIYGNKLRLSSLTVLLTLTAAGLIAGVPGAIVALPLAAAFPIVEKIWLKDYLASQKDAPTVR